MDVTSLLNTSTASILNNTRSEQPPSLLAKRRGSTRTLAESPERSSKSSSPPSETDSRSTRSRTPWNADGYVLPLHIETKEQRLSVARLRSPSERFDTPSSSGWESRASHSRCSSEDSLDDITTSRVVTPLMGMHPVLSPLSDLEHRRNLSTYDSRPDALFGRYSPNAPTHKFSDSRSSLSSFASSSVSAAHSRISSVTTVNGFHSDLPLLDSKLGQLPESPELPMLGSVQPPSPFLPPPRDASAPSLSRRQTDYSRAPSASINLGDSFGHSLQSAENIIPSKFHKRAISAPNCGPLPYTRSSPFAQYPVLPLPQHSLTRQRQDLSPNMTMASAQSLTVSNHQQDGIAASPIPSPDFGRGPRSGPTMPVNGEHVLSPSQPNTSTIQEESGEKKAGADDPCCMFVEDCNTGSQLRKAISHLFGRNKNCTQQIPKHVWVYYCRKHYQRVRYRNASTYPLTQMSLVKTQLLRLQAWSAANEQEGKGSVIESWDFSLRKREQKRLNNENADDSDEEQKGSHGGSVVPAWVINGLGRGYKTDQIMEIVERMYEELKEGELSQIPEVEFLPNIVERGSDKSTKPMKGRRQNSSSGAKTPKRKASEAESSDGRLLVSPEYQSGLDDEYGLISPSEKRARIESSGMPMYHPPQLSSSFLKPVPGSAARSGSSYTFSQSADGSVPRAPTVVPKIQQSIYSAANAGHRIGRASYDEAGEYMSAPRSAIGFGTSSHLSLPSISSQLNGYSVEAHAGRQPLGHPSRPSHQRSASAYTPESRSMHGFGRPSSSGHDGHEMFQFTAGGAHGPASHDMNYHGRHHAYSHSWSQHAAQSSEDAMPRQLPAMMTSPYNDGAEGRRS
ncbi:hypothetical protein B0I35DRAFT_474713 [Stachybotrys elegans]|uniref:ORP1 n=1 Tax=Stachybotrys elegans TaxID=80388 RepID=A0A8K0T042_9HYPO|nr:hypothetical protein B0I35DRAFT_474713 [Stachybotrys elegans]